MFLLNITFLFTALLGVVNADCQGNNVIRALRRNSQSANTFCQSLTVSKTTITSTIMTTAGMPSATMGPSATPVSLPPYISRYSADRVSSACACLSLPALPVVTVTVSQDPRCPINGDTVYTATTGAKFSQVCHGGRASERYYDDGPPFTFRLFSLPECLEKAAQYLLNPLPDMPIVGIYFYEDPQNPEALAYPYQATCFLLHDLSGDAEVDNGADTAYLIVT